MPFRAAFAMAACGSDSSTGNDQAPDPGDTTCTSCRTPPEKPDEGVPGDGTGATLAISKVFLGDTTPDGVPDQSAWKSLGYVGNSPIAGPYPGVPDEIIKLLGLEGL